MPGLYGEKGPPNGLGSCWHLKSRARALDQVQGYLAEHR